MMITINVTQEHIDKATAAQDTEHYSVCTDCVVALAVASSLHVDEGCVLVGLGTRISVFSSKYDTIAWLYDHESGVYPVRDFYVEEGDQFVNYINRFDARRPVKPTQFTAKEIHNTY